jgi:hypothetical protein
MTPPENVLQGYFEKLVMAAFGRPGGPKGPPIEEFSEISLNIHKNNPV